jgi:protein-S-isoprenylcysteine O-methyltransferase Ste14
MVRSAILTIVAVGQIVLTFLFYNKDGSDAIRNIGWFVLWISAVFGWLPIFTFKKWGGVAKGKSYIQTTVLVTRGVYGIVRHPQYLAGMLMAAALAQIAQHWIVVILGAAALIIYYADMFEADKEALAKFGDAYKTYMESVPRANFVLGIFRRLRRTA